MSEHFRSIRPKLTPNVPRDDVILNEDMKKTLVELMKNFFDSKEGMSFQSLFYTFQTVPCAIYKHVS